jgi:hypothetical protein
MLIQIKNTDYIVGVWMVERVYLGKAYILAVKGANKKEWIMYIRYKYNDCIYNMYGDDNDYKNTISYNNITEIDIIKICNNKMDDLSILFCNNKNKVLINGDIYIYNKFLEKNTWLPTLSLIIKKEKRK